MKSNYHQSKEKNFKETYRIDGVSMGLSLRPVLANIIMSELEIKISLYCLIVL